MRKENERVLSLLHNLYTTLISMKFLYSNEKKLARDFEWLIRKVRDIMKVLEMEK